MESNAMRAVNHQAMLLREARVNQLLNLPGVSHSGLASSDHVSLNASGSVVPEVTTEDEGNKDSDLTEGVIGNSSAEEDGGPTEDAGRVWDTTSAMLPALVSIDPPEDALAAGVVALCFGPAHTVAKRMHPEEYVSVGLKNFHAYQDKALLVCLGGCASAICMDTPSPAVCTSLACLCGKQATVGCRDNHLYLIRPRNIIAVHKAPCTAAALAGESLAAAARAVERALRTAVLVRWGPTSGGNNGVTFTPSGPATAQLALALTMCDDITEGTILDGTGWPEALAQARGRVKERRRNLRAAEKAEKASRQGVPLKESLLDKTSLLDKASRLRAEAESLRGGLQQGGAVDWPGVLATVKVLQQFEALLPGQREGERFTLLQQGLVARDIRFENELWLALILAQPSVVVWPSLWLLFQQMPATW
jgi:hypothetical protein